MILNLLVLFICINFALGMVTGVEGSPLKVELGDDECHPYKMYAPDVDDLDGDGDTTEIIRVAPAVDPISQNPFEDGSDDIGDLIGRDGEMTRPTNSTNTDPSFGAGETFNGLLDAASRGWKGMETMLNIITGGYIMDIVEHVSFSCSLDKRAFLTGSVVNGVVTDDEKNGNGHVCAEQTMANGYPTNQHITVPCENATYGKWTDPMMKQDLTDLDGDGDTTEMIRWNPMFDSFKGGVQVIFGLLLVITMFYWLTGRGHMLSS